MLYLRQDSLYVFVIVLFFMISDKNVHGSTVHVTPYMCPISKKSWIEKSEQTHCQKPKEYHCFRASRNQYVDVCLLRFNLNPRDGCPYIELYKGLSDLLQYFKCTASNGCPNVNDPVYNSTELYKYPACIYGNAYTTEGYYNNKKTTAREREEITTKKLTEDTDEQVTTVNSQSTDIDFLWKTSSGRGSLMQQPKDNKSKTKKDNVILKIGGPVAALIVITMVVCLVIICRRRFSIPNKSVTTIDQELHQVNFTENKEDVYMEIKDVPSCSKENYYNAVYASDQHPYQTHEYLDDSNRKIDSLYQTLEKSSSKPQTDDRPLSERLSKTCHSLRSLYLPRTHTTHRLDISDPGAAEE